MSTVGKLFSRHPSAVTNLGCYYVKVRSDQYEQICRWTNKRMGEESGTKIYEKF